MGQETLLGRIIWGWGRNLVSSFAGFLIAHGLSQDLAQAIAGAFVLLVLLILSALNKAHAHEAIREALYTPAPLPDRIDNVPSPPASGGQ